MWKRTVLSAFCAAAMLVTGVAYAQDSATLTLRSGEKVSGQLVDLGGVGYTVRVNGAERQIPQPDVAVIDFTGGTMSDADWAKFTGTSQVVLRNGQTIDGTLYDIGGTSPLRLTIKTASGQRELASTEVARILISRPANAVPAAAAAPQPSAPIAQPDPTGRTRRGTPGNSPVATAGTRPGVPANGVNGAAGTRRGDRFNSQSGNAITVSANQPWTSTGITVQRGQTLSLTTTGEVQLSDNPSDIANADGAQTGRFAANAPMRRVLAGALIGRIGPNGAPFAIGNQTSIVAPAAGLLFLGVNDDGFSDNRGNFQVVIR